jgi:FkbM family methyltransferase
MYHRVKQFFKPQYEKVREPFIRHSYSQSGEDMIIDNIFRLRGIELPTYLDIGANHPFFLNNTAFFYEKGSSGINVEANPDLIGEFIRNRKRDTNINVGIGQEEGEMDFFIMEDSTLSTFSSDERDNMLANGKKIKTSKQIKLITVSKLLELYANGSFPDFLSLDIEGLDLAILSSINFSNSFPKVICVEAADYSPIGSGKRRDELIDFVKGKGYYEYANTNLNAIMVKNEFWFI